MTYRIVNYLLEKILNRKPELSEALKKEVEHFTQKNIQTLGVERFNFVISDYHISCLLDIKINNYEIANFEINADLIDVLKSLDNFKDINPKNYLSRIVNEPEKVIADGIKALKTMGFETAVKFPEPQQLGIKIVNDNLEFVGYTDKYFNSLNYLVMRNHAGQIQTMRGECLTSKPFF